MLDILNKLPDDLDRDTINYQIEMITTNNINNLSMIANEKDKELINKMEKTALNQKLSFEEKSFKLSKYKMSVNHYNQTLFNQQKAYTRLLETIKASFAMNVINKDELLDLIIKLTEIKTTNDLSKRNILIREVNDLYNNRELDGGKSNDAKLVKKNPLFQVEETNYFSWNTKGYVKITLLTLLSTFVIGILTGFIIISLH